MTITFTDFRNSEKKPLDLLREARRGIDQLAETYPMVKGLPDIQRIYGQLDGAIYKLEGFESDVVEAVTDARESEEVDDTPMTAGDMAKLAWNLLTKE